MFHRKFSCAFYYEVERWNECFSLSPSGHLISKFQRFRGNSSSISRISALTTYASNKTASFPSSYRFSPSGKLIKWHRNVLGRGMLSWLLLFPSFFFFIFVGEFTIKINLYSNFVTRDFKFSWL